MEKEYPLLNKDYYNHERIICGPVRVLYVAKDYFSNEEHVVFQIVHTQEIRIISLQQWDEMINVSKREGCMNSRPRFYHN
jgi:hypothetical protein